MTRLVLMTWLAGAAVLGAAAEPAHHAITTERIAAAMSGSGVVVSPEQVNLLSTVVATSDTPQLRVRSISVSGKDSAVAWLECDHGECIPFVVTLHLAGSDQDKLTKYRGDHRDLAASVVPDLRTPLVHKGSPAVLMLNRGSVHISIPVTCLDNGGSGQTIRVSATANHQVFSAQVVGPNELSGRF